MRTHSFASLCLALALFSPPAASAQLQARPLRVDPALPTTADAVVVAASDFGCPPLDGTKVEVGPDRIEIHIATPGNCLIPVWWLERIAVGRLPAGPYLVTATLDGAPLGEVAFTVAEPEFRLLLHGGQFWVTVERSVPAGAPPEPAHAVQTTDRAGYFWFFNSANPEAFVKVLDGRPVNGHFWVFVASLTNVETTVTVMDVGDGHCLMLPVFPPACPTKTYRQPAGTNQNFLDTLAFDYTGVP